MNNGNYNSQNGNNNNENEEIRFDESDFQDQYSQYYSQYNGQNNSGYNGGNDSYYEPIDFSTPPPQNDTVRPQINKAKKHFSRIGLGYALFSAITLAVSEIIANLVCFLNEDFYNTSLFMNAVTPVALYVFALPVLLIVLSGCEAKVPEKKKMGFWKWMLILVVSFGCMYIGSYVGNFVMAYLSEVMGYDYGNALNSIIDEDNIWITAIFTVIVAPIGEELVFRKLIIDRTNKYGAFVSIGLSALMFGLMHGNFYQFFYCFAIGIILGYIYYTTGNLFLTIALHAAVNFFGSVVTSLIAPFIDPVSEWLETADTTNIEEMISFIIDNPAGIILTLAFSFFVTASMACAIIFPIVFRKKLRLSMSRGSEELPNGRVFEAVIINGGIIAMFIVYFLEFGLNLLPV